MAPLLPALPDAARVWTFALAGDADRGGAILDEMRAFCGTWTSHGRPVPADAALVTPEGFPGVVLAVAARLSDGEVNAGVSGCGIDAMQHAVEVLTERHGVRPVPALSVVYRGADGAWQAAPRPAFRALTRQGDADGATRVLDLTATTLGALRAGGVDRPAAEAWHGRAFRLA